MQLFNLQFHPLCTWNFPQFPSSSAAFFSPEAGIVRCIICSCQVHMEPSVNGLDPIRFFAKKTHRASGLLALRVALVLGRPEFILLMARRIVVICGNKCDYHLQQCQNYTFHCARRQVCNSLDVCAFTATIPTLWSCFSKPLQKPSAPPGCCSLQRSQPRASKSLESATCWNMCHGQPNEVMTIPRCNSWKSNRATNDLYQQTWPMTTNMFIGW